VKPKCRGLKRPGLECSVGILRSGGEAMSGNREEFRSKSEPQVPDAVKSAADARDNAAAHRDVRRRFVFAALTVPVLLTLGTSVAHGGTQTKTSKSMKASTHHSVHKK
jgi:hypothetical protein